MSILRVQKIRHTASNTDVIDIASDGTCRANIVNNLSNRNKVINGAMICSQRATQVTGSTDAGYKTVDRFRISHTSLGTFTIDQDSNAPDGFSKSLKLSCTTADASPAASDQLVIQHRIEAQNLQDLAYGTSSAKKLVLSFYVKSNKTGNASVNILQTDNSSKMVGFQYTISAANTWERKTIPIPADTSGVINNDNGYGLQIEWFLNSGSNFTGGSHQATYTAMDNTNRNPSNLGIGGSTSDNFAITGVQLEVDHTGSGKPTDFEHRSYGQELQLCKRYFNMIANGDGGSYHAVSDGFFWSANEVDFMYTFPVEMRATPSIYQVTGSNYFKIQGGGQGGTTYFDGNFTLQYTSKISTSHYASPDTSGTQGFSCHITVNNPAARLGYNAEL